MSNATAWRGRRGTTWRCARPGAVFDEVAAQAEQCCALLAALAAGRRPVACATAAAVMFAFWSCTVDLSCLDTWGLMWLALGALVCF